MQSLHRVLAVAVPAVASASVAHPDWDQQFRADAKSPIELTFAVKQQNLARLEDTFHAVSNPDGQQYGHHLTLDEVNALTAPLAEDVASLMSWLHTSGVQPGSIRTSGNMDFLVVTTTVGQAESLLQGQYHEYQHATGASALRMETEPQLPSEVLHCVDFVSPTNQQLPRNLPHRAALRNSQGISSEGFTNTPKSLRKLYSVGDVEGSAVGNKQAVTGFLEQHRTNVDLQEFFKTYYPKGSGRKISKDVGDGASEGHVGGQVEAELDTQYIMAMGGGIETEFWTFTGRAPNEPENEPFLKFMSTLSNTSDADVPLVVSVSYGEDEDLTHIDYANRLNVEFQKAAVRGISLLFSSGDSGVAGISSCGSQCAAGTDCFVPQWPAASPYITSVGGTKQYPGGPELAYGISSGGFSNRWSRPDWQTDVVAQYLTNVDGMPDSSKYQSTGRAFPDIAAQSANFMVILDMIPYPVSGTSCSAPTVAGIISLLNDLRLQKGQAPLGFLPPLIYGKWAGILQDITSGSNPGCDTKGFPATVGWDAVTGMGTPNYSKMAEIVSALPAGRRQEILV